MREVKNGGYMREQPESTPIARGPDRTDHSIDRKMPSDNSNFEFMQE
jgi:hypothetical protein